MQIDGEERITRFVEKPQEDSLIDTLKMDGSIRTKLGIYGGDDLLLASMVHLRLQPGTSGQGAGGQTCRFRQAHHSQSHQHGTPLLLRLQGYWEDIGTIKAFFDANPRLGQ